MKQLLSNFKGHIAQLCLGPAFKLAEAILELMIPLLMADIIDTGVKNGDVRYIVTRGGLMLLLGLIGLGCALVCQYFAALCAHGFGRSLRRNLFRHIMGLSATEYGRVSADSFITRVTNDANQVQTGVNMFIRLAVRAPFLIIGSVIMALSINRNIGLVFVVFTPVVLLVLYAIMSRSLPYYTVLQKGQDTISRLAGENLAGARVIRAFSRQESEATQFDAAGQHVADTAVRVGKISALLNPITGVLVNTAIILIIWLGGLYVDTGVLQQGEIIALVSYMTQTLLALIVLANLIVTFTKAIASARRVIEVLELESSMPDSAADAATSDTAPRVVFDDVSFTYPNGGDAAVEHISFAVDAGETLGIIGGTGCGKTTLVRLLTRAYDTSAGTVRIDGADVREWPLRALHTHMGLVPQNATLFSGTIRDNLRLGSETADDAALWRALETAQSADFVRAKPNGLDEMIEEKGKNLSGGQRQRLTIARALVPQPPILILDDAASALDYATDAKLRKALKEDAGNRAVIMISQRASTLKNADRILVLDDGKMAGIGTHSELLATCEVYKEICASQGIGEEAV